MEEKKEIMIGDKVTYNGNIYECRRQFDCEDCAFNTGNVPNVCFKPDFFGSCSCLQRIDNCDVIFVKIGKEKPSVPKTEFALDEEFQCGLKRLKCVKSKNLGTGYLDDHCVGCFFWEEDDDACSLASEFVGNCTSSLRSDGNDVIFVEVEPKD